MKERILIAEDEDLVSEMITQTLTQEGYEIETASNGQEALEILYLSDIDLVICDIMMPIMDGYELTDHMKEDPKLMTIPIIFLTAKTSDDDQILGRLKGVDDFITKPFDAKLLLGAIKARLKWVEKYRAIGIAREQTIQDKTIEALARTFFRQSFEYGFKQADYLRFVNSLLDITINTNTDTNNTKKSNENTTIYSDSLKNKNLPLIGKRIRIRALDGQLDKPLFNKWLADEKGKLFILSRVSAKTINLDQLFSNNSNIIGVITLHDNNPIGSVAYLDYDVGQGKAELRKLIGEPSMRGKGFAKEASQLWIQYGISTLQLKKIYLNTLDTDLRNIKLNEDLGFKVEGILRNEILINGSYQDVLRMGLWID